MAPYGLHGLYNLHGLGWLADCAVPIDMTGGPGIPGALAGPCPFESS